MIFGVGTDIVNIARIEAIIRRRKARFVRRILAADEQRFFKNRGERAVYCATRFAAKESFAKALGTGIGGFLRFHDLSVHNDRRGKPYFVFSENLRKILDECGVQNAHLSLADERQNAVALVILEK